MDNPRPKPEYNAENCAKCPLSQHIYVPDKIKGNKILFIATCPAENEIQIGEPLVGKAGKIFQDTVNFVDISWEDVSIANICNCMPLRGKDGKLTDPDKKMIKYCTPITEHTINLVNPEWIVALGDVALKFLLSKSKPKITDVEGTVQNSKYGKVIPLFHPSYLNYKPYETQRYRTSFQRMKEYIYGTTQEITNIYKIDDNNAEARNWFFGSLNGSPITVDVETTGLNLFTEKVDLLCLGLGTQDQKCIVGDVNSVLQNQEYKELLENPNIPKIAHNFKFDLSALKKCVSINVKGRLHDVMIAHYLDSGMLVGKEISHKLKNIAKVFGIPIDQVKEVDPEKISIIPKQELYEYNKSDVVLTTYLFNKIPKIEPIYSLLCRAIPMLADTEARGLLIDTKYLETFLLPKYEKLYNDSLNEIQINIGNKDFNPNSPKQVREYLLEQKVKLPKTEKDNYSASAEVLEGLNLPISNKILKYREYQKALSTYIKPYIGKDKVHTNYNIHFTKTGRLSSDSPNVQNIIRDKEFRRLFVAPEDYYFVSIDFSMLEPKVLAFLAGEHDLLYSKDIYIDMFKNPKMYGRIPTKEERQNFKTRTLGMIYLKYDPEFMVIFYRAFPKVAKWITTMKSKALKERRIDIPYTNRWRDLSKEENFDEIRRIGVNSSIQSIASDININAGINIFEAGFDDVLMCNNVHDETDFYIRKDLVEKGILNDLIHIIEESPTQLIPEMKNVLKVEAEYGENWGNLQLWQR